MKKKSENLETTSSDQNANPKLTLSKDTLKKLTIKSKIRAGAQQRPPTLNCGVTDL
jgi:hypothetical protein